MAELATELKRLLEQECRLTVLTGAGVSAESGVPTFRGKEGYWTIGSKVYHPQEMATRSMFLQNPWQVWQWYLHRLGLCYSVEPNEGHRAIATLEKLFQNRFTLITQNVDGLHLRAGSSIERSYHIHGNLRYMRCSKDCSAKLYETPLALKDLSKPLNAEEQKLLRCPNCSAMTRPHVLWFDECYDEELFKFESSLLAAANTDCLIVVGTSGATTLPLRTAAICARNGAMIVDINPQSNPFSEIASTLEMGFTIRDSAANALPRLLDTLQD